MRFPDDNSPSPPEWTLGLDMPPGPQINDVRKGSGSRWLRWGLIVCICSGPIGCSSMRKQVAQRRETCHSLCQQARNAKKEGWPDQADLLLNEAVRQRPEDLETRRHLADSLWECGRQQDAIDEYIDMAKTHSRDVRLHQQLAKMCWTVGQRDQAAQSAEKALRIDPTSADALLVKARCELARREFDAAVASYIRLSRAAPDLVDAKLELAEVHVERGHAHQACTLLRDVIAQPQLPAATRADAEWKLGLAYASAERWIEAANHLSNSIDKRDTSTSGDWQLLMVARALSGQETGDLQAKAVLASAQQGVDGDTSAWAALRDRLVVQGELAMGQRRVAQDRVIRADFSKSAQADPAAERARQ